MPCDTKGSVCLHTFKFQWGTKYRNKVLKGHVEEVLKQSLYDIASKYGFTIAHMEIGKDDHIHLRALRQNCL